MFWIILLLMEVIALLSDWADAVGEDETKETNYADQNSRATE